MNPPNKVKDSNPWHLLSFDEEFKRCDFAIAVLEGRHILMAGGSVKMSPYHRPEVVKTGYIFDSQNGSASVILPQLPRSVNSGCSGALLNNNFYIIGYDKESFHRLKLFKRQDQPNIIQWGCEDHVWEKVKIGDSSTVFSSGFGRQLVSDRKRLFLIGGRQLFNQRVPCGVYDPVLNHWAELPQLITPRYDHVTVIVGTRIYVIGGISHDILCLSSVEIYDIKKNVWTKAPDLPLPLRGAAGTLVAERYILISGGICEHGWSTCCFLFDTFNHEWTNSRIKSPKPITGHGCVCVEGLKVVCVGFDRFIEIADIMCLFPNWHIIGHFILLRRLLDDGRASIRIELGSGRSSTKDEFCFLCLMTRLNLDMFRLVLSFISMHWN